MQVLLTPASATLSFVYNCIKLASRSFSTPFLLLSSSSILRTAEVLLRSHSRIFSGVIANSISFQYNGWNYLDNVVNNPEP